MIEIGSRVIAIALADRALEPSWLVIYNSAVETWRKRRIQGAPHLRSSHMVVE